MRRNNFEDTDVAGRIIFNQILNELGVDWIYLTQNRGQ
jgi:hypothetical protein